MLVAQKQVAQITELVKKMDHRKWLLCSLQYKTVFLELLNKLFSKFYKVNII